MAQIAGKNRPGHTPQRLIRNFSIIAHIDHGKSTVADRILQLSGVVPKREMRAQYLDRMPLERERGITIKSQAVRVPWTVDGTEYTLGMIDTPGHVDFTYEVSRSLAACEGAVLLVDATQGIEAQTLSNLYMAIDDDLTVIPVLNKIDLPSAEPDKYAEEIANLLGCEPSDVLRVSGKTGEGIPALLDTIVRQVPAPSGDPKAPARALIFDSVYDSYRGIVTYIRMVDGEIRSGERVRQMGLGSAHDPIELGVVSPNMTPTDSLGAGEVGYIITGVKDVSQSKVGDTITTEKNPAKTPLPGYREPEPMVYAGIFPVDTVDYPDLRDALDKLKLNDAALTYEPETSVALGLASAAGSWACCTCRSSSSGSSASSARSSPPRPTQLHGGGRGRHHAPATNPSEFDGKIRERTEPMAACEDRPWASSSAMMKRRSTAARSRTWGHLSTERVDLSWPILWARSALRLLRPAWVTHVRLRDSTTRRTASRRPTSSRWTSLSRASASTRSAPSLSTVTSSIRTVMMTKKLSSILRQLFEILVQAGPPAAGSMLQTIRSMRKANARQVLRWRHTHQKRKLLGEAEGGKKRMKMLGKVEVPQEAFVAALSTDKVRLGLTDSGHKQKIRAARAPAGAHGRWRHVMADGKKVREDRHRRR